MWDITFYKYKPFEEFILLLNNLVNKYKNFGLIFTSIYDLDRLVSRFKHWRELANLSFAREIKFLEEDEIDEFIDESSKDLGIEYHTRGKEAIKKATAGHPLLLQLLCHHLINYINTWDFQRPIDFWDIEDTINTILGSETDKETIDTIRYIWDGFPEDEKWSMVVLNQLINERAPRKVTLMEFGKELMKQYTPTVDFISSISSLLGKKTIIENESFYTFNIKILEKWMKKNIEELKQILKFSK